METPLKFYHWEFGDELEQSKFFKILEPITTLPERPEVVPDVMLVPLMAFNQDCFRLGYGGGFYDRTIA